MEPVGRKKNNVCSLEPWIQDSFNSSVCVPFTLRQIHLSITITFLLISLYSNLLFSNESNYMRIKAAVVSSWWIHRCPGHFGVIQLDRSTGKGWLSELCRCCANTCYEGNWQLFITLVNQVVKPNKWSLSMKRGNFLRKHCEKH